MKRKVFAVLAAMVVAVSSVSVAESPMKIVEMTDLLFDAISKNDTEQAKLAISAGANLKSTRFDEGLTPLIYAIKNGRADIVEALIKSKADVNVKNNGSSNRPPLVWAVSYDEKGKRDRMVEALVKANADLNEADSIGWTPATLAVNLGHTNIIDLLIKSGVDINAKDKNGKTLLMHAVYKINVAEMLIKMGADVNAKANNGYTALMYAAENHRSGEDMVALLIKSGADVNAKANNGYTALKAASDWGVHKGIVALLKTAGAVE
ncbi:MAG: ankyrin repeat domain-containing protein [Treponema sp.]|nr:ankyrin repeat domain-containing protein [Treponema sp.]